MAICKSNILKVLTMDKIVNKYIRYRNTIIVGL